VDQTTNPSGLAQHQDDPDTKLGFYNLEKIKKIAQQAQPFLIKGLILPGSLGVLVGEWGIGKSPFAILLAIVLAAGLAMFLNHFQTIGRKLRVLYVDCENGAAAILDVVDKVCRFLNLQKVPDTFRVYSPNYCDRPEKYRDCNMRGYILQAVQERTFDLIIIDPLRAFCPEAETKNEDAIKFFLQLRQLAKSSGATVMLIHHPRKPKDDVLYSLETDPHNWLTQACGSGAIIQNVDFRMGFQKSDDGVLFRSYLRVQGWGPVLHLVREYDDDDQPIGYRLEGGIDKLDKDQRQSFDELPKQFTTGQFKKTFNLSNGPSNEKLNQFVSLGIITNRGRGKWEKVIDAPTAQRPPAAEEDDVPIEQAAPEEFEEGLMN
jgi:archaellum biogenesis ATPase FlaH